MLIIIFCIGLVFLAVGIFLYAKFGRTFYNNDTEWIYLVLNAAGTVVCVASLIAMLVVGISYSDHAIIDDKIEIYRNENEAIEQQIEIIVDNFTSYESDTFQLIKGEDAITFVTVYPELKSNELIVKQIDIYTDNKNQIKYLECEKLNYRVLAWWLFFGGKNE